MSGGCPSTMSGISVGLGRSGFRGCSNMSRVNATRTPARPGRSPGPHQVVIARFFHSWEHRLATVSKDRVVRPFEWGTDWIGGGSVGNTREDVERWVDEIMRDTDAFFATPPTTDYEFAPAAAELRDNGEAGTLLHRRLRHPAAPRDGFRRPMSRRSARPVRVAVRSSCSRNGTPTRRAMLGWQSCWRASACPRSV